MSKMTADMADDESEEKETPSAKEGVKIPEEFQSEVHALLASCDTTQMLDYIRSCVSTKDSELRDREMSKKKPKGAKVAEYSTTDMPKD